MLFGILFRTYEGYKNSGMSDPSGNSVIHFSYPEIKTYVVKNDDELPKIINSYFPIGIDELQLLLDEIHKYGRVTISENYYRNNEVYLKVPEGMDEGSVMTFLYNTNLESKLNEMFGKFK